MVYSGPFLKKNNEIVYMPADDRVGSGLPFLKGTDYSDIPEVDGFFEEQYNHSGQLYGLSMMAYENSECNKCRHSKSCQDCGILVADFECRMYDRLVYLRDTQPQLGFTNLGPWLKGSEDSFNKLQEYMILHSAKLLGIPARLRHPRVFLFL